MTTQSQAKIFLAAERGLEEDEFSRSYQTFNFGKFFNDHKMPFGDLYAMNDDSLAGGRSSTIKIGENSWFLLLPVVGAVDYKDSFGNTSLTNAGELQLAELPAGAEVEISNPYEAELVNYIQLLVKSSSSKISSTPIVHAFDLAANKNSLVEVVNTSSSYSQLLKLNIGQFRGREEALYSTATDSGLFIFIIEGAFEVQGRLLHPRDGLALWNLDEPVALEALSNEAIIVLIELKR